jgi:hypothetical protein
LYAPKGLRQPPRIGGIDIAVSRYLYPLVDDTRR